MSYTLHRGTQEHGQPTRRFLLGCLTAALILPAVALLLTAICYTAEDPGAYLSLCALATFLLAGVLTGIWLGRLFRQHTVRLSLLVGLVCALLLLLVGLILTHGSLPVALPLNLICYLGCLLLFAWLCRPRVRARYRPRR